jgi:hypothetical protein
MILATNGIIASQIVSVDPDWLAYYNRVIAAGGSLTTTEQSATLQLVLDLKANSLWTPMKAIYPMVGASAAACAQNLKSSSFTGVFNGGVTFSSTGVLGNGTTGYMNSQLIPSGNVGQDDAHLCVYSRSNITTSSIVDIGCLNAQRFYIISNFGGASYVSLNGLGDPAGTTMTDTRGLIVSTRINSTTVKMYRNGSVQSTVTQVSTGVNTVQPVYVGAYNNSGSASFFSSREYAFASIGLGLTDTQASNFYTAVQAFQTTLSRNV